jgi:hypothetical protein
MRRDIVEHAAKPGRWQPFPVFDNPMRNDRVPPQQMCGKSSSESLAVEPARRAACLRLGREGQDEVVNDSVSY